MDKIHAGIVELAVVELFDYRKHFICPNISFGWDLRHEADLIIVDKNLRATEVEVKVTLQDLKADFKKALSQHTQSPLSLCYRGFVDWSGQAPNPKSKGKNGTRFARVFSKALDN